MGPGSVTRTTCPYCGVGCGVLAETAADGKVSVRGDPEHPANYGRLCSKGTALAEILGAHDRLTCPMIRGERASWDEALDLVADRFADVIRRRGPEAVAFYVSGQFMTEDYYVANKLAKGFLGTANIDTNSRLCMSSAVAAHKRAFGTDTVPVSYADLEAARLVILVGSNLAWCHPVIFQRLDAAKRADPGLKVVVVDPRRTATCGIADLHLPLLPGTDGWLLAGLLAHSAEAGLIDREFVAASTTGFDAALEAARAAAPDAEATARACGLAVADVASLFRWWAGEPRAVTLFSQGINQSSSGTDKGNAIINLHLATGRIGKEGAGPFSITGQPNAMGGREVGGLANQLAAHVDFGDAPRAEVVRRFWNSPGLPPAPGLKAVDMFEAVADGRIEALWIMATNPAVSLPDADKVAQAIARCPFTVVSDCVRRTDTTQDGIDVLLPAAGWGERDGTITNSERRISRQRPFVPLLGEAKPDWWIITQVARRLGFEAAFPYQSSAAVFREHAALSGLVDRDFDIAPLAGLDDAGYQAMAPVRWPVGKPERLFADGRFFTPDGRARFVPVTPRRPAAAISTRYPLLLLTGRYRDHWHTQTLTARAPSLGRHRPEALLEVHPQDARRFGLVHGGLAEVEAARGRIVLRVQVSDEQRQGTVFAPIHWTGQQTGQGRVGALIDPVTDPVSGQPESKATAVAVRAVATRWSGFAVGRSLPRPAGVRYWSRSTVPGGFLMELAGDELPSDLAAFAAPFVEGEGERLEAFDPSRARYRAALVRDGRLERALCLGDPPPRAWLVERLAAENLSRRERLQLLAGQSGGPDPGPLVCACFGVGRNAIQQAIRERGLDSAEAVGAVLRAGTNCGSCLPEVRGLVAELRPARAA